MFYSIANLDQLEKSAFSLPLVDQETADISTLSPQSRRDIGSLHLLYIPTTLAAYQEEFIAA